MYRAVVLGSLICVVSMGCATQVLEPGVDGLADGGLPPATGGSTGPGNGGAVTYETGGALTTGGSVAAMGGGAPYQTGGAGGAPTCNLFFPCPTTGGATSTGGTGAGAMASGGATGAASCDNALCWDIFDCFLFHPDLGHCAFTKCEGFVCKP